MKMKNKQQEQSRAKNERKEQAKIAKLQKISADDFGRTVQNGVEKKSFLIVCEGKNTEPSYFAQFKGNVEIKLIGMGANTFYLVEKTIKIAKEENEKRLKARKQPFDEVWCVFDADPNPKNPKQLTNFKNAIDLANSNGINVAYSNQAFEYWFILHFEDHQGGTMHRADYHDKINQYLKPLNCSYDGKYSKKVSEDFFEKMLVIIDKDKDGKPITRQDKAIARAKKILLFHKQNGILPANAESSTTVFELVEKIK